MYAGKTHYISRQRLGVESLHERSGRIHEVIINMAALGTALCLFRSYCRVTNLQRSKQILVKCSSRTLCSEAQDNSKS